MNNLTWINERWRSVIAIIYCIVCLFDMVIAPVMWTLVQAIAGGNVTTQWVSMTAGAGGLFHIVVGSVLGLTFLKKKLKDENRSES